MRRPRNSEVQSPTPTPLSVAPQDGDTSPRLRMGRKLPGLFSGTLPGSARDTTFRIAQISDTHLSGDKPFFVDNFVRIGEALRAERPDLVLNSGDIALDGASSESDLAAARALHDGLDLPVRFLPGNHDIGDCQDAPSHGEGTIDTSAARATSRISTTTGGRWTCRAGACSA